MLTVVCVCKSESGSPYGPGDITRLWHGVARNLSVPYRFTVLTDTVADVLREHGQIGSIEIRALEHDWRGWWSKLEVFALPGPILYIDLDTVIVGSLDELAAAVMESDRLVLLRGFYRGDRCSGIMGWGAGVSTQWIPDSFIADLKAPPAYIQSMNALRMACKSGTYRGDQEWLDHFLVRSKTETRFVQDLTPGVYSYKVHIRGNGQLPTDARIICFHGSPRPCDVANEPWMHAHWQSRPEVVI